MAKSFERGWEIYYDGKLWRYSDTKTICDGRRPCKRCRKEPNSDGSDFCLGEIQGVSSACCGHGVSRPILKLDNKTFERKVIYDESRCPYNRR